MACYISGRVHCTAKVRVLPQGKGELIWKRSSPYLLARRTALVQRAYVDHFSLLHKSLAFGIKGAAPSDWKSQSFPRPRTTEIHI